jgi:HPt (histidine-containing phosphotransfer) domain-containing protein
LEGLLTMAHAREAHARISSALASHASVVLDVSGPKEIDLTFLQILIAANKTARAAGRRLLINAPADGLLFEKLRSAGLPVAHAPQPKETRTGEDAKAPVAPAPAAPTGVAAAAADREVADLDMAAFSSLLKEIGVPAVKASLETFFAEMQERIDALRSLSVTGNLRAILREAHSLRGTAGAFGLRKLGEDAAELERTGAELSDESYRVIVDRIGEAFVCGRAALENAAAKAT